MKRISIVGVEGSGKTVLMSVLGVKYVSPNRDGLFLSAVDKDTYMKCSRMVNEMDAGIWPGATLPGTMQDLKWHLMRANSRSGRTPRRIGDIHFLDFAGEDYKAAFGDGQEKAYAAKSVEKSVEKLKEHVSQSDVLLVLMNMDDVVVSTDDDVEARDRKSEVLWLTRSILEYAFRQGVGDFALVFTQKDKYEGYCEKGVEWMYRKYLPNVESLFPCLPLFAVSAVRVRPDHVTGKMVPVPGSDKSDGIDEVLKWMAEKVEQAEKREERNVRRERLNALLKSCLKWSASIALIVSTAYGAVWSVRSGTARAVIDRSRQMWHRLMQYREGGAASKTENLDVQKKDGVLPLSDVAPTNGECRVFSLPGNVAVEMIYCASGSFMMGSPTDERGRDSDEVLHEVSLTKGYWIGKYPVTQAQWNALVARNNISFSKGTPKASFSAEGGGSDKVSGLDTSNFPMESISWDDCDTLVKALNSKETSQTRWMMPTEAQWEFAARGGNKSRGYKYSGGNNMDDLGWYFGNSGNNQLEESTRDVKKLNSNKYRPHPVNEKNIANELGIVGMSGNVWEWCADWYGSYPTKSVTNPKGPASGDGRVLRGGCWCSLALFCRSAERFRHGPGYRSFDNGFRLACSAGPCDEE